MKFKSNLNNVQMIMSKHILLIAAVLLSGMLNGQTKTQEKANPKRTINENIEWTNSWVVANDKHDLTKVLVMGDSHVNAYYPVLAEFLKDKAYVSKFTTSKSLGDPVYIEQLKWFLKSNKFEIISINNGLHGIGFTLDQYAGDLPVLYKIIRKYQPAAKLIWVNTTARRIANRTSELDSLNRQVIERNKVVSAFCNEKQIPLLDLYILSAEHPGYFQSDGIHFQPEGVNEEAKRLQNLILQALLQIK